MGVIKNLGPKLQPKISDPDLTLEELDSLVAQYLDDVSVDEIRQSSFSNAPAVICLYSLNGKRLRSVRCQNGLQLGAQVPGETG
jgi:hypothetical protein